MGRLNQVEHDSKKKCVYKLEFNSGAEVVKNRSLFNEDGRLCGKWIVGHEGCQNRCPPTPGVLCHFPCEGRVREPEPGGHP